MRDPPAEPGLRHGLAFGEPWLHPGYAAKQDRAGSAASGSATITSGKVPSEAIVVPDIAKLAAETSVVQGRSCGTCTLCCKLFAIPEVPKPAGKWCQHCQPGKGCRIYDTRPPTCRKFFCGWMVSPGLGPEWKPERCKVIVQLLVVDDIFWFNAFVDEGYPAAWQRPEIYNRLKKIASGNAAVGDKLRLVVRVHIGKRQIVILPDRDVDAGTVTDDEELTVAARNGTVDVRKVKRTRPAQAANMAPAFSI
jgi:hypothetical protein